jgi:hypothetical protein
MKKVIRLTESDLVRLVKKIVNEQDEPKKFIPGVKDDPKPEPKPKPGPMPEPVGKIEKRPFDKMVGDCLKKDGFTVKYGKNAGEPALNAFKKGTPKGDLFVKSVPGNPSKYLYTLGKPDGKTLKKEFSVNSSSTCESIVPK